MKKILPVVSLLLALGMLSGCVSSMGEYNAVGCVSNQGGSGFSMKYEDFDGTKYYIYSPEQTLAATLTFETLGGTISCNINAKDNDPVLVREKIRTGSFRVKLEKGETYTFRFRAEHHKGSFDVRWEPLA